MRLRDTNTFLMSYTRLSLAVEYIFIYVKKLVNRTGVISISLTKRTIR